MTDVLNEIITSIDNLLKQQFTGKYYGICEVVNGQAERYPVTITAQRERVSPMDTWQLQTYHKLGDAAELPTAENFGRRITIQQNVAMVVIANVNVGEYFIHKIARTLPDLIKGNLGFAVRQDGYTISPSHPDIVSSDFGAIEKERLVKNLWQINYVLNVTECEPKTITV